MSYAKVKGRASSPDEKPEAPRPNRPAAPIDEAEHARIAANNKLHKLLLPEFAPFVKELHAVGLIDGWRAIQKIEVFRKEA